MNERFIRFYKKADVHAVKEHLFVYGDLSAQCAKCQATDIKLDAAACPKCQTEFKYIAFRNVRQHLPKLQKISEERPDIRFVDFDDYKRETGAMKAKEFLK